MQCLSWRWVAKEGPLQAGKVREGLREGQEGQESNDSESEANARKLVKFLGFLGENQLARC